MTKPWTPRWNTDTWTGEAVVMPAEDFRRIRDALSALAGLHRFGEKLMNSEVMEERGIGCCICESTRVLYEEKPGRQR